MKYTQQTARFGAADYLLKRAGELYIDKADFLAIECIKEAIKQADAYLDEWYATGEGYESEAKRMQVVASYKRRVEEMGVEYTIRDAREEVRGQR
jgi:hypothetical protein